MCFDFPLLRTSWQAWDLIVLWMNEWISPPPLHLRMRYSVISRAGKHFSLMGAYKRSTARNRSGKIWSQNGWFAVTETGECDLWAPIQEWMSVWGPNRTVWDEISKHLPKPTCLIQTQIELAVVSWPWCVGYGQLATATSLQWDVPFCHKLPQLSSSSSTYTNVLR